MGNVSLLVLIAIPFISAVTGYATNHIAVRMLFRPRAEHRLLGLRLQGLIPRRRSQIAHKIGETIHEHLISHDDIRKVLEAPEVQEKIRKTLEVRISRFIKEKLPKAHPMAAMFITDELAAKMKTSIMAEVMKAIPSMTDEMMKTLEENLDFRGLAVEKIEQFDLETFENIILRIASRELRAIEVLGGVLGFGIGLLTVLLLLF